MGKDTKIQWCDSTINGTTGCDGCELWKLLAARADMIREMGGSCYAAHYHETRMAKALPHLYAADFTEVRMVPGRMAKAAAWSDLTGTARPGKPWLDGMPRVIFVGDMGDFLSEAVTFDYIKAELIDVATSAKGRRHIWMVLTKRPGRLAEFARWLKDTHRIDWPENIWAGTSITGKASLGRVAALKAVPVAVRFLSVEPLVEAVDLRPYIGYGKYRGNIAGHCVDIDGNTWHGVKYKCRDCGWGYPDDPDNPRRVPGIDLVIVGGESGPDARPFDVAWARSIVKQCRAAGVPAFVKQLGRYPMDSGGGDGTFADLWPPETESTFFEGDGDFMVYLKDSHGGDMDEFPEDLRVREFPALATAEGGAR